MSESLRYDLTTRLFHWLSVVLILILYFYHPSTEHPAATPDVLVATVHISLGALFLLVILARSGWKLRGHGSLPAPLNSDERQTRIRNITFRVFYIAMLAGPVFGVLLALTTELKFTLFGLSMPSIAASCWPYGLLRSLHGLSADVIFYLAILHAGIALYHQFKLKDGLLRRMA